MDIEVANGSWRHGLILSVRCGEVRRQAPLAFDTRISFPQEAVAAKQVQVDVFAKIGTDYIVVDPRTELYALNIGGDADGFSGLALRVRPQQDEGTTQGGFRARLEDAQATDEYIEQHDLRQFASQVVPQQQQQALRAPPKHPPGALTDSDPGDTASVSTEERLQRVRQDAAEYVERFDLRQVLQSMFQRVIRERPENPFEFMQEFLSNGSGNGTIRPWAVASIEADAIEEEKRMQREQEREGQLAAAVAQLEEQRARIQLLETRLRSPEPEAWSADTARELQGERERERQLAAAVAQVEAQVQHIHQLEQQLRDAESRTLSPTAAELALRREQEHQHQLTLARAQVSAQARRIETLEQQLADAAEAKAAQQELADAATSRPGHSPSAESDAAQAAVFEAAAARDAAVARELAAAAAAVQASAAARDAAVARELATLAERTELQRRCHEFEHQQKEMEHKIQELQSETREKVNLKEASTNAEVAAMHRAAAAREAAAAKDMAGLMERMEAERNEHAEARKKCAELERSHEDARKRCSELERFHQGALERCVELERANQEALQRCAALEAKAEELQAAPPPVPPVRGSRLKAEKGPPELPGRAVKAVPEEEEEVLCSKAAMQASGESTAEPESEAEAEAAVQDECRSLEEIRAEMKAVLNRALEDGSLDRLVHADQAEAALPAEEEAAPAPPQNKAKAVLLEEAPLEQKAVPREDHEQALRERAELESRHHEALQKCTEQERRLEAALREQKELEGQHEQALAQCARLERRCSEAEWQQAQLLRQVGELQTGGRGPVEAAAPRAAGEERGAAPEEAHPEEELASTAREMKSLSERVEVERRCHEQALVECAALERRNQQVEEQRAELERRVAQQEAAHQVNTETQHETARMLQRRIQELEASASASAGMTAAERAELAKSYEQQLRAQQTRIEVLQRRIQAYEACGTGGGDSAAGAEPNFMSPRGDAAAGGSRGSAKTVDPRQLATAPPATSVPPPFSPRIAGGPAPFAAGAGGLSPMGAGGGSEVNTHMLSQLLASTYAPPVPPSTYLERREDEELEAPEPNPGLLVEVVDCKDVMSNGIFAWVGVCNLRPLYRLLGPEPRYLYYAEADIASNWRIVNKMGSEEFVERFRKPADAKLPVDCEKGDAGGSVVEVRPTAEILQKISMINSHEEKVAIRARLAEAYSQHFAALEGRGRGLVSRASPVVAVAHALESQQRAIQLLHSHLTVETQRREAAEKHSQTMVDAFETLQLRIQAQLPGPPSVSSLQEVQAAMAGHSAKAFSARESATPSETQERGLVFEKDGKADWAPDLGPGCGPVPHPPITPKDRKPVPPPTFRRGPYGLRNSKQSPAQPGLPVASMAPALGAAPATEPAVPAPAAATE